MGRLMQGKCAKCCSFMLVLECGAGLNCCVSHRVLQCMLQMFFVEQCVHLQCLYKICFMENMLPKVLSNLSLVKIATQNEQYIE